MRKGLFSMMLALGGVLSASADGEQASITSTPSPIVSTKGFEVKIQTSDFGSDVYCYTWAKMGSETKGASDWAGSINAKFKMTGSGGSYTLSVTDIQQFYGLTDSELEQVTELGFIARTSSRQTADCMVPVVQGRRNAYSGGEGTADSPFVLKTAADIADLSTTPGDWDSGVYFRLDADITVGSFAGIGSKSSPFKGVFDGNGHLLKNAVVANASLGSATGVFNAIDGATIKKLGVVGVDVSGSTFTGGLIGYAASGTVDRCFSSGIVESVSICAGGLIGENHATVTNCYSTATVRNDGDYVAGGLVGKNKGSITNTYASGAVSAHNYAGGLVGANYGTVNASVAMNASVTGAAGSNYVARFGGNNNAENINSKDLSWRKMPLADASSATHGHNADDSSADLVSKDTYQNLLGWDFLNVWEWRTEGSHSYPVLAGLAGQVDPATDEFYKSFSGVEIIDAGTGSVSVYPNPVESDLHISGASEIVEVAIYSLSGAEVLSSGAQAASDIVIDCGGLNAGMYLLCVRFADGSRAIEKIIKK